MKGLIDPFFSAECKKECMQIFLKSVKIKVYNMLPFSAACKVSLVALGATVLQKVSNAL
jgi:hypothetical protein